MTDVAQVDVLGVKVSAVSMSYAVGRILQWVNEGSSTYVCVTGVHGVMESQRDPELMRIHNESGLTTPDGMPLVWAGRWAGASRMERVYGPDLMSELIGASSKDGVRHYFYGGRPEVVRSLASALTSRFPDVEVAGMHSPPFRSLTPFEEEDDIQHINESKADIVWVGLGTPKQEQWMARLRSKLDAAVLIGVGAAFDIHAGNIKQAPRWMQRSGLEWLYRLGREPRRLASRYLRNNPAFVAAILRNPPRLL